MDATCLINNYNYRDHVGEAVRSALAQTCPFVRVVIVDDGSTDGSTELLHHEFGDDPRVVIVEKTNGGQLSSFNEGIKHADTELVFFLDADDRYHPEYLAAALDVYHRRPQVDFLTFAPRPIGEGRDRYRRRPAQTKDMGITALAALLGGHWIGEPTSCLSMRTAIARKVLPYPHEEEWITRADDVLVLGGSIVGAFKRHEEQGLVDYRIHAHNHFAGRKFDATAAVRRSLAINRLMAWYGEQMGFNLALLPQHLHREFRTRERPTLRELRGYCRLARKANCAWSTWTEQSVAMLVHYLGQRKADARSPTPAATPELPARPPGNSPQAKVA